MVTLELFKRQACFGDFGFQLLPIMYEGHQSVELESFPTYIDVWKTQTVVIVYYTGACDEFAKVGYTMCESAGPLTIGGWWRYTEFIIW